MEEKNSNFAAWTILGFALLLLAVPVLLCCGIIIWILVQTGIIVTTFKMIFIYVFGTAFILLGLVLLAFILVFLGVSLPTYAVAWALNELQKKEKEPPALATTNATP
jgi:signal transduction histidine kinase